MEITVDSIEINVMKPQSCRASSSIYASNGTPHIGFNFVNLQKYSPGFTLIEVLVVTIILGIALSLAVANLIPNEREKVRIESERVSVLLEKIRDESAMSGKAIAVAVRNNTLQFFERNQKSVETQWLPLSTLNNTTIEPRAFADGTIGELWTGAASSATNSTNTANLAVFQPAGVALPFELRIQSLASAMNMQVIRVDALGNVMLVNGVGAVVAAQP